MDAKVTEKNLTTAAITFPMNHINNLRSKFPGVRASKHAFIIIFTTFQPTTRSKPGWLVLAFLTNSAIFVMIT